MIKKTQIDGGSSQGVQQDNCVTSRFQLLNLSLSLPDDT